MGFLDSLFGVDDARDDIRRSKRKADAALREGYEGAQRRYDQAYGIYQPLAREYGSQAQEGRERYLGALGYGSPEQREQFQDLYFNDPAQQRMLEDDQNRMLRYLNARGMAGSGKAALAGQRVARERYGQWRGDMLNRLGGLYQRGDQNRLAVAGQQAGIRSGQANLDYGYGATRAGNEINFGNAMSQTRGQGLNNLLDFAGSALKAGATAYAASDIRLKRDIERVGEMPSGLPVYTFRYVWSDEPYMGVMAQEALAYVPHAVAVHDSGYLVVDYAAL